MERNYFSLLIGLDIIKAVQENATNSRLANTVLIFGLSTGS